MQKNLVTIGAGQAENALPGVPFDYLNTPVYDPDLRERLRQREVLMQIMGDQSALPTTEAREGYFGDRHLEYWLSGHRDANRVVEATGLASNPAARILDFGGATARVVRHFTHWCPAAELYLSDINPRHVAAVQSLFGGRIFAFRNQGVPSLPFADGYFDAVVAFSVFTHIDADDTAWLLELRRIVRSGGHIYLTVHDEYTWDGLANWGPMNPSFAAPELVALRHSQPTLAGKIAHYYNQASDYNCNVFVSRQFIADYWSAKFASVSVTSSVHDHQAAVVLKVL